MVGCSKHFYPLLDDRYPFAENDPLLWCLPVAEAAAVVHAVDPALAVLDDRRRGVHHHRVGNRRRDLEYVHYQKRLAINDGLRVVARCFVVLFIVFFLPGPILIFLFVHHCRLQSFSQFRSTERAEAKLPLAPRSLYLQELCQRQVLHHY